MQAFITSAIDGYTNYLRVANRERWEFEGQFEADYADVPKADQKQ